jgi:hypothetical protein
VAMMVVAVAVAGMVLLMLVVVVEEKVKMKVERRRWWWSNSCGTHSRPITSELERAEKERSTAWPKWRLPSCVDPTFVFHITGESTHGRAGGWQDDQLVPAILGGCFCADAAGAR